MIRYPAPLQVFLGRVWRLELILAIVQLLHLSVFTQAKDADFVAWMFVHSVAQLSLWILRRADPQGPNYLAIPWKPLLLLLLASMVFKLSSRAPLIMVWLSEGLLATRTSDELAAGGGMASYANIFFYPLAILLAFTSLPRKAYRMAFGCVMIVCLVDLVVLGTRNAPVFVLLFHFLALPSRFQPKRVLAVAAFAIGFVALFAYSTVNRTFESTRGGFDWLFFFQYTNSTEVLKIDPLVAGPLAREAPATVPALFLSHYLSHSLAEVAYLYNMREDLSLGHGYYVIDQFCAIGLCSRLETQDDIMTKNPRAGVYQTIWASLAFDFGIVGAAVAWVLVIAFVIFLKLTRMQVSVLAVALASVVVMLGMVENYMYNGLGLAQVLTIVLAYALTHGLATKLEGGHDAQAA